MKKQTALFFSLITFILLAYPAFGQVDTVTILHVNDTHSNLAPTGPRDNNLKASMGGIARAATLIGMTRMTDPNVVVLHAGDVCIGDLFYNEYFGVPELQLMAALGFDAMTAGNHEFDLTPATLIQTLDAAFPTGGFPLLSANLVLPDSTVQPLGKYIHPYVVKQEGSVKVGIFGMTTPATDFLSQPSPAFFDTNIVEIASAMVDTLRAHGCTMIVCLSHLGVGLDNVIAQYVPGINVIVGGHDHYLFEKPQIVLNPAGDTTFIVQAGAFYQHMGKLQFIINGNSVKLLSYTAIPLDASIPEEPTVATTVAELIAGIEAKYGPLYSQRIGYATEFFEEVADSLTFDGPKDTPIGNLVTDAFRAATGTEIAIEAGGSTAQPLTKGPITGADVFRVVGYGFNTDNGLGYRLATFTMTGASILAGLEFGLSSIEQDDEYLIQASGLSYTYNPHSEVFSRLSSVMIGNHPLDPLATYSVSSNEYTLSFLDYLKDFVGLPVGYSDPHVYRDTSEFQVLSAYISKLDTIQSVHRKGILSPVKQDGSNNYRTPSKFSLSQNYPNPFNPSTTIEFSIPQMGHVTLTVYDLIGKEVATLVSQPMNPGLYTVQWNASNFPSGVYFCRLNGGTYTETKKLMLLK
jgi:5'-nucleotidase